MYQDTWICGQALSEGERDCSTRYEYIKRFLQSYDRPITVLDIGANQGYFSFRIAEDFEDSTCVMIEGNPSLLEVCGYNEQIIDNDEGPVVYMPGVVFLNKRFSLQDLKTLSECEHFDVVLALNVLHHFSGVDTEELVDTVMSLGDNIIIESPPVEDIGACGQAMIRSLDTVLRFYNHRSSMGETPSHTSKVKREMFLYKGEKTVLTKQYVGVPDNAVSVTKVDSGFGQKYFRSERKNEIRPWISGINFRTFREFGGVYPDKPAVKQHLTHLRESSFGTHHGDVRPWNMIINRNGIHLIDYDDRPASGETEYSDLDEIQKIIDEYDEN
jgi:SAM-dependent methyltransferase